MTNELKAAPGTLSEDQIEDIGFAMLPNVPNGEFKEFARAILAAAGNSQSQDAVDAARYGKLRDADPDMGIAVYEHVQNDWGNWAYRHVGGRDLDAAIAAMGKQKGGVA